MNEINNKFEAYKIVNEKLNKEVDEYYQINILFSAAQTIGIFGYLSTESRLSLIPLITMLVISYFWKKINGRAYKWREHWLNIAKDLESEGVLGKINLWKDTEEVKFEFGGVWKLISHLPYIFFFTWVAFLIFYFLKYFDISFLFI